MECIDWMQCYSNQSITANEWLQQIPKQRAKNRRGWTRCSVSVLMKWAMGAGCSVFKLSGGRLSAAEGRVAMSADFTFNSIPVVCFDTLQRTNKFL